MKTRSFKVSDLHKTLRVAVRDLGQTDYVAQDALFTVTQIRRGGISGNFHQQHSYNSSFNRDDIKVLV